MLKDITKIKISGAIFDSLTSLDFFNAHDGNKLKTVKGALTYGRNGSGKSTIAKGFRKLAGENIQTITNATVHDEANRTITLSEEEKKHIFIFDEDYIDKNVRLQQDHLDTIVLLGQAADLTDKIQEALLDYNNAKEEYELQEAQLNEYKNYQNIKSPKYHLILLGNALRGDDNWAGRNKEINGARQNKGVKDATYKQFVSLSPTKTKTDLISEYKKKIKELEEMRTGISIIDKKVPKLPDIYQTVDEETIYQLLGERIEKPELSSREKKLLVLLQEGRGDTLLQRLEDFQSEETVRCPYCFQAITPEYKQSLVESIEKILSKIVEEHQKKLQAKVLDFVNLELSLYTKLNSYSTCTNLVDRLNAIIQKFNDSLNKKIANPYEPIVVEGITIKDTSTQLLNKLDDLENERLEYNNSTKKKNLLIKELNQINSEIAHYDVIDLAMQYEKQQEEYIKVEEEYKRREEDYKAKKKTVEDLEAQRRNVQLAIDEINACLKYIFFAENRLEIEYVDGVYKLLSYGKNVKPCDVSVGERNIIGLSYFFTSILDGQEEKNAYEQEYLLIIDDPVSSYDLENRIGILSFLKYKLSMFLEGNVNTKVLLMTHDLRTFYDFHKILEEIMDVCKQKGWPSAPKFNQFEICQKEIRQFSYNKRQEYTEIVQTIYKYARGQADDFELVIGNMMRQALEAFSTFEYKKGIEDVSTDEQILGLLNDKAYISYYKNLMYRLVLHGGSHKEEQIKTMNDFNFFSLISESEKQRTAKDVLCFIYLLNKRHLLEHLKNCEKVDEELQAWCSDIRQRDAMI